ncbi:MAG TPA: hypothetical protein VLH14_00330 [Patescibacteria group bacterium]|nr:hypothetical protein [Patescibacteria group bacterium]
MTQTELLSKPNKLADSEPVTIEPDLLDSTKQELPLARELGAKVCASVQELWELYPDRRDGITTQVGMRIVEIEGVAMRDYGQHQLEETIVRSQVYHAGRKAEHGSSGTVSVHIRTDEGEELITVDVEGAADVRYRDGADDSKDWLPMPFQRATSVVDELSHRAVIAAVRHGSRTPEEKAVANEHAAALLRNRFPLFGKPETSLE